MIILAPFITHHTLAPIPEACASRCFGLDAAKDTFAFGYVHIHQVGACKHSTCYKPVCQAVNKEALLNIAVSACHFNAGMRVFDTSHGRQAPVPPIVHEHHLSGQEYPCSQQHFCFFGGASERGECI